VTGTWLSRDPLPERYNWSRLIRGGQYHFLNNDPLDHVDYLGLQFEEIMTDNDCENAGLQYAMELEAELTHGEEGFTCDCDVNDQAEPYLSVNAVPASLGYYAGGEIVAGPDRANMCYWQVTEYFLERSAGKEYRCNVPIKCTCYDEKRCKTWNYDRIFRNYWNSQVLFNTKTHTGPRYYGSCDQRYNPANLPKFNIGNYNIYFNNEQSLLP